MTRKQRNSYCRSSLQDAIRCIKTAESHWPVSERTATVIAQLQQLKSDVKFEQNEGADDNGSEVGS